MSNPPKVTNNQTQHFIEAVETFLKAEGLNCLTPDNHESYFSSKPCDSCNQIAGDRYDASGYNPSTNEIQSHYSICQDCVCYLANGDTPETYQPA